jgi:hypothetical protein
LFHCSAFTSFNSSEAPASSPGLIILIIIRRMWRAANKPVGGGVETNAAGGKPGNRSWNNKQAMVLIVGLILWLLVALFPPRVMREAPAVPASRGFLFSSGLYLHQTYDPVTKMGTSSTHYAIDRDRLPIEWAVLALGIAVVFVACRPWRDKKA